MAKKILSIPLLILSMVFFMQCSNDALFNDSATVDLKAGKGPGGGGGGGGGGGEEETAGNNLSFPVIRTDGFQIPGTSTMFTVPYEGDYDASYTAEEVAALIDAGPWYPQKTEGNVWQAGIAVASGDNIEVDYVDWGDVIEAVKPTVGRPFRLEVTLYADVTKGTLDEEGSIPCTTLTRYTMAVLENPSSPTELQGTNTETTDFGYATIVSSLPKLVIQSIGSKDINLLTWDGDSWQADGVDLPVTPISFAPELNVGGKYIYGASTGGWRPTQTGMYRLTFYLSEHSPASKILFSETTDVMNFTDTGFVEPEIAASEPRIDYANNLTYVDVEVVSKGGGGRR